MDKRTLLFVALFAAALFAVNWWFNPSTPPQPSKSSVVPGQQQEQQAPTPIVRGATTAAPSSSSSDEKFYVLENGYQQLVFSNIGGALAEINLPLKSKNNPKSVVLPINFDTTMKQDFPQNDRFPAASYAIVGADGKQTQIASGIEGGYYPLLRRSLYGTKGTLLRKIIPQYYALNLMTQDGSMGNLAYSVRRFEKNLIEFEATQNNRKIVKTYSFPQDSDAAPYCFDLNVRVDGDAHGLWLSSGVPEVELISGSSTPTLKYRASSGRKAKVEQLDLPKLSTSINTVQPDWVCNSNGFLGMILDPIANGGTGFSASLVSGEQAPTRISLVDAQYNLYPPEKYPGYELQLPLSSAQPKSTFRVFAGPFASDILKKVDAHYAEPEKGYNPDYISCQSFHGWFSFISEPFAKFLFFLMNIFYQITRSWGVAIILLTVALRVMLYPLNAWSIKSTIKMQEIAPQVSALQERYKKDPKRAQLEVVQLYREKKVNPLSGCFPLLIQMPFLIGMFDLLKSTFELRGASFIPGWIPNLTAPDVVFSWNYPVIFFGTDFHLLPIILGAVMYFQQKFSSATPKDPKMLTDQQKQQKMMGNIMVIVFTVMFYHFPSGLNIYWLSSMLLGILQQWWMAKKNKNNTPNVRVERVP